MIGKMADLEEDFKKFQTQFEQTTLTLIANMNRIAETLERINGAIELTEKIRIQNAENKQVLSQLTKQLKAVTTRLDRMSRGGFEIPEAPPTPAPAANDLDALFNAKVEAAPVVDDLEKEFGALPEDVIKKTTPTTTQTPATTPTTTQTPATTPTTTQTPVTTPTTTQTPATTPTTTQTPATTPTPTQTQGSKFSVSGWTLIEKPQTPQQLLNNLMVEIENAEKLSDVGQLILGVKDTLSKTIPFNQSYFDMLMVAGKWAKKDKPNSEEVVKTCFEKIKEWQGMF